MLGPAPILDFDGTLARLEIDWSELRAQLGVQTVNELWSTNEADWTLVTDFEIQASEVAHEIAPTVAALAHSSAFSILTANSERAVSVFMESRPQLAERLAIVVGRETLEGPKLDATCFHRGYQRCLVATASVRGSDRPIYLGDDPRELALASNEGAIAYNVTDLDGGAR